MNHLLYYMEMSSMQEIILDGRKINDKKEAHAYLKEKLEMPEYYGNNLDALWDVLSTYDKPVRVELIHEDALVASLGTYGEALIETFQDAVEANSNIEFQTKRSRR